MELIPLWLYDPVNIPLGILFSLVAFMWHCVDIANSIIIAKQERDIEISLIRRVITSLEIQDYQYRSGRVNISKQDYFRFKRYLTFNIYYYYFLKDFIK